MVLTRRIAASLPVLCLAGALAGAPESAAADSQPGPSVPTDVQSLQEKVEGIMAKEGISVNGMFRSQYLHSSISGDGAVASRRSEESIEYTSVDFDIRARPNTLTQGRLMFRMHQDWRNFFSDVGNPITARWISIDGQAGGVFRYNVGDYRQKYSPLTLYSPDIALLFEPEIFAAQRRDAMSEAFLGGNDRLLQGVNMNLDASLENSQTTLLRELHLNVLGARLRNVETAIGDGSKVTSFVEKSYFEKFLGGANADLALPYGLNAGGSYLVIFDKLGSYNPGLPITGVPQPADPELAAQFTNIFAGRGGVDVGSMLGWSAGSLSLGAEYAMTQDDTAFFADTSANSPIKHESIDGAALMARLQGGWSGSKAINFKLGGTYHRNEADFRNELAQTPSFRGERIMNLENDSSVVSSRIMGPSNAQYTTFDALYRHAFKFSPSAGTNSWHKAPFSKNSYNKSIMTQGEMAAFAANRTDIALQMVMPFGPATANRDGFTMDLSLGAWEDKVQAAALFSSLKEIEGDRIDSARALPATAFAQFGGGLKFEIGSMLGFAYPLTLSGSFVRSSAENDGLANDSVFVPTTLESDFLNAGLRYKFWRRAAVLAGYQQIKTRNTRPVKLEETQQNISGGLEYKIADGAYVTGEVGRISFEPAEGSPHKEFSQLQTDLFLSVRF
jgi:hypothetical protein